jgi:hypothetical protein
MIMAVWPRGQPHRHDHLGGAGEPDARRRAQDRILRCVYRSEPHLGQRPYAAVVSLIASLEATSGAEAGVTGSIPPRLTARPRGATL